ncbi:MAG TPA: hypothetical protein VIW19_00875 [Gaiellaceae bacterium]|jgi:hypothetical protein
MSMRPMALGGAMATACVVAAFSAAVQCAQAALKPEAPPQKQGSALKPVPGPGAGTISVTSPTSSQQVSAPSQASRPASSAGSFHVRPATTSNSRAPQRPTARRESPPARASGRFVGFRDAAGFVDLQQAARSEGSALLLAAGLLLVLLAIGETAFLAFVGPPAPSSRRPPEDAVPIRRIQLRR